MDSRQEMVLQFGDCVEGQKTIKKTNFVTKHFTQPRTWMDSLAQPKHWKKDMRFGTWNVRSLYMSGSFRMVTREVTNSFFFLLYTTESCQQLFE
jgi:hypothetical protein